MGYLDITDKDGNTPREFTQVSWDYISEQVKRPNPRISFPLFDLQTYLHINTWAGRFVDTTYLYNSYIQFWALKLIHMLFANGSLAERQTHKKFLLADIKISDYNAFKLDFEHYLSARMPEVKVKWDHIKNVGPLITSN
jgi:hypothetical protein